jgi:hypothetical protein
MSSNNRCSFGNSFLLVFSCGKVNYYFNNMQEKRRNFLLFALIFFVGGGAEGVTNCQMR